MAEAVLNGTVVDDGGIVCEGRFVYGPTLAMALSTPWSGALSTGQSFSATVTGLLGNTVYYFQAQARNALGTSVGATASFVTTVAPSVSCSVATMPATLVTERTARLNGMIEQDAGRGGAVRFVWGPTSAYGNATGWQQGFQAGNTFFADISGLSSEQAYHFRAEFRGNGEAFGADATFSALAATGLGVWTDDEMMEALR